MLEHLIPVLIVAAVGLCVLGGLALLSGRTGLDHIDFYVRAWCWGARGGKIMSPLWWTRTTFIAS